METPGRSRSDHADVRAVRAWRRPPPGAGDNRRPPPADPR
jgi:hypothetical protein